MQAQAIFGGNVKRVRKATGLSQEQLALQAGIGRSYMSDIETGRRNPTIDMVGRIALALNVNAALLVDGIPERLTKLAD